MTAMMTFFLVMWLINTASKEKITKLASYFNPVKLTDRNPAKGVHDNEAGGVGEEKTEAAKAEKKAEKPSKKSEAEKKSDAEKKPETEKHQSEDEQLFIIRSVSSPSWRRRQKARWQWRWRKVKPATSCRAALPTTPS